MERIFILHLNRTGSTRLSNSLSQELGIKHYASPFRDSVLNSPKELSFYFQNPCILQERVINETEDRLRKLIEGFDKVILLTRRDLESAIQSWAYVSYNRVRDDIYFKSHATKYVWEKTPNYEFISKILTNADKLLKTFSQDYSIPITYYEDLYYISPVETVQSFNLDINAEKFAKKYLNTDLRQRRLTTGSLF